MILAITSCFGYTYFDFVAIFFWWLIVILMGLGIWIPIRLYLANNSRNDFLTFAAIVNGSQLTKRNKRAITGLRFLLLRPRLRKLAAEIHCAYCKDPVERDGSAQSCPRCGTVYHCECVTIYSNCSVFGCDGVTRPV